MPIQQPHPQSSRCWVVSVGPAASLSSARCPATPASKIGSLLLGSRIGFPSLCRPMAAGRSHAESEEGGTPPSSWLQLLDPEWLSTFAMTVMWLCGMRMPWQTVINLQELKELDQHQVHMDFESMLQQCKDNDEE
uniref:Uncharacterized protein n=1 Tax=Sphaerodactylus townsendi TaxID=933632 RepID=A0ACB8G3F3_9SAUR